MYIVASLLIKISRLQSLSIKNQIKWDRGSCLEPTYYGNSHQEIGRSRWSLAETKTWNFSFNSDRTRGKTVLMATAQQVSLCFFCDELFRCQFRCKLKMKDLTHKRNVINTLFICSSTRTSSSLSFLFNKSSLEPSPTLNNYATRLLQNEHKFSVRNILPPDAGSASLHVACQQSSIEFN